MKPLWEKYHEAGLSIIAVDNAGSPRGAKKLIEKEKLPFHFVETKRGKDDPCIKIYKVESVPYNLILNEEGRVFYLHKGFSEGDEKILEAEVKKILENQ